MYYLSPISLLYSKFDFIQTEVPPKSASKQEINLKSYNMVQKLLCSDVKYLIFVVNKPKTYKDCVVKHNEKAEGCLFTSYCIQ